MSPRRTQQEIDAIIERVENPDWPGRGDSTEPIEIDKDFELATSFLYHGPEEEEPPEPSSDEQ